MATEIPDPPVLQELRLIKAELEAMDLPQAIKDKIHARQRERDRLIYLALREGISERKITAASGVTRGWLWKLKKKIGPL